MTRARSAGVALVLAAALLAGGCAHLFQAHDVAPNGLARHDDALRRLLVSGRPDSALARVAAGRAAAPADALLRELYHGALAHYAGRHEQSNAHLARAAELSEDRITRSVSRGALALLSSDRVLPYEPGRTEQLLIPYYAALNFLRLDDAAGALVEARRLAALLQRFDEDGSDDDRTLRALLREFTGAVFAAGGERNDADVAFRNAAALGRVVPDAAPPPGHGRVVVLLEHGFVAHRVESSLNIMLLGDEVAALTGGSAADRLATAGLVAARAVEYAAWDAQPTPYRRRARSLVVPAPPRAGTDACNSGCDAARTPAPYLLRVAWPGLHSETRHPGAARLLVPGLLPDSALEEPAGAGFADVSSAAGADFARARAGIATRAILRAVAKLAITRAAEEKVAEKNEGAGELVGWIGSIGGALLEQADTRSWHLLPGAITLLHVDLPAGEHELTATVDGAGRAGRSIPLGHTRIEAGRTAFLSARIW